MRRLLSDGATRLADRHQAASFSDGDAGYAALFPEYFGQPYRPPRQPGRGRPCGARYRIPRTAAHVQIVKPCVEPVETIARVPGWRSQA